jgi:hypothetical protein
MKKNFLLKSLSLVFVLGLQLVSTISIAGTTCQTPGTPMSCHNFWNNYNGKSQPAVKRCATPPSNPTSGQCQSYSRCITSAMDSKKFCSAPSAITCQTPGTPMSCKNFWNNYNGKSQPAVKRCATPPSNPTSGQCQSYSRCITSAMDSKKFCK